MAQDFIGFGCDGKGNNDTHFRKARKGRSGEFQAMVCPNGNPMAHW